MESAPVADHHSHDNAAPSTARWFNLDDAKVKSVREEDLKSQFSGKESAYMLFYRRYKAGCSVSGREYKGEVKGRIDGGKGFLNNSPYMYEIKL